MTVRDLAQYLKVHPSTIYRLLKREVLPAFKVGSDWRFNVESIDQWRLQSITRTQPADHPEREQATVAPQKEVDLYARDYRAWAREQAQALRNRRAEALDWDNLAEEFDALARNEGARPLSKAYRRVRTYSVP
jgi:excisionase family DNA binding protein